MKTQPRVIVIDDDMLVRTLFSELLPEHNLDVVVAEDAEVALNRMKEEEFDLVVTDKNLPGMSGLDLLREVKENYPDLDVILMTAYADMESVLEALKTGVYDYLVKPFPSLDEVHQKIHRALEKRAMMLDNRRLIKNLTEANRRIEALNRDLEGLVEERTKQLTDANKRLEELTLTDDVTGLYNQRFLYQRIEEEFERECRYHVGLAVMMLDLDNFKLVNDEHDHLFGSRVLRRVGEVLRQGVRNIDQVIRYGGDEFVVILSHAHLSVAIKVAERLRSLISANDFSDEGEEQEFHITVSIGIADLETSGAASSKELLGAADKALYGAKGRGRNCVVVAGQETNSRKASG